MRTDKSKISNTTKYPRINYVYELLTEIKISDYLSKNYYREKISTATDVFQFQDTSRFHLKLTVCIITICFYVMMNDVFVRKDFSYELKCFDDKVFNLTEPIHRFFSKNDFWLDFYLIISGFFMDIAFLLGFYYFATYFRTWRMLVTLLLLYIIRGNIQNIYLMGHPEGLLFRDPGIISLTVPYHHTHDYFFSGHVSMPTIIGMEFYKHRLPKHAIFCFFVSFFEMMMMIFLRGHYSIDLYAGIIVSLYLCRLSDSIVPYIDNLINGDAFKNEHYGSIESSKEQHINKTDNRKCYKNLKVSNTKSKADARSKKE